MSHDASPPLELLHAATDRPMIVVVGERRFIAIDGVGGPRGADHRLASETLRTAGRHLRHRLATERGVSLRPGILETAWWVHPEPLPDQLPDAFTDRSRWHWQQMIEVPDAATEADVDAAIEQTQRDAGRSKPLLHQVSMTEGRAAQMLHLGGSASAASTLRALFDLLTSQGLHPHGHIHELRIAEEGDVPADRARSILRVPIEDDLGRRPEG
jgi:hypothetical protein